MIDIILPSSSQNCLHNTAANQTVFGHCSRGRTRDTMRSTSGTQQGLLMTRGHEYPVETHPQSDWYGHYQICIGNLNSSSSDGLHVITWLATHSKASINEEHHVDTKRDSLLVEAEETSHQCCRVWPGTVLETSCSSLVPDSGVPTTSNSPRALGAELLVAHGTCS